MRMMTKPLEVKGRHIRLSANRNGSRANCQWLRIKEEKDEEHDISDNHNQIVSAYAYIVTAHSHSSRSRPIRLLASSSSKHKKHKWENISRHRLIFAYWPIIIIKQNTEKKLFYVDHVHIFACLCSLCVLSQTIFTTFQINIMGWQIRIKYSNRRTSGAICYSLCIAYMHTHNFYIHKYHFSCIIKITTFLASLCIGLFAMAAHNNINTLSIMMCLSLPYYSICFHSILLKIIVLTSSVFSVVPREPATNRPDSQAGRHRNSWAQHNSRISFFRTPPQQQFVSMLLRAFLDESVRVSLTRKTYIIRNKIGMACMIFLFSCIDGLLLLFLLLLVYYFFCTILKESDVRVR